MTRQTEPMGPYRALRLATNLSLRQLAERTGINPGRLSIIERGVPPTEEEARRILSVLVPLAVPEAKDLHLRRENTL